MQSRLLAILIRLQLRKRLTASALAREFEVSVRTIYRDIDRLSAAGVPVYGDKGPGGGFALLDGYSTRLTGLDRDEAEAMLLVGLPQLAAQLGLGPPSSRALDKLQSALPEALRDLAARTEGRIHLDPADWYRAAEAAPFLPLLARAVLDQRHVAMTYDSWSARREWSVAPLGLVLKGGQWYLVAEAAGRITTFRAGAIAAAARGTTHFERPADFDLAAHWAASVARFEREIRPLSATVRLSPDACRRLAETGDYAAVAVAQGRRDGAETRVELPIESIAQGARLLLGVGGFSVVAPAELGEEVAAQCRVILRLHEHIG